MQMAVEQNMAAVQQLQERLEGEEAATQRVRDELAEVHRQAEVRPWPHKMPY